MNHNLFFLLFLLFLPCYPVNVSTPMMIACTVQFPRCVERIPDIRIYYGGSKIKTETDHESKRLTFCLPRGFNQSTFYLLVTPTLSAQTIYKYGQSTNTIEYLKVPRDKPYKLFELTCKTSYSPLMNESEKEESEPAWHIEEISATQHQHLRIPDMTVIVCYDPDLIDILKIHSKFELPTIHMKQNIIDLVGSQQQLHSLSNAFLLSCIDTDVLHTAPHETIKQVDQQRYIIAPPTT